MPEPEQFLAVTASALQDRPWAVPALVLALVVLVLLARRRPAPRPRAGEVWFAMVPFEGGSGAKDRPVLVLSVHGRTCTVAPLTSQDKSARRDHARVPAGVPGLAKASWVSLRPQPLRRSALRRRSGTPGEGLLVWYRDAAGGGARARG